MGPLNPPVPATCPAQEETKPKPKGRQQTVTSQRVSRGPHKRVQPGICASSDHQSCLARLWKGPSILTLHQALCNQIEDKTPLTPWDGIRLAVLATRRREVGSASFAFQAPSSPQAPVPGNHSRSKLCFPAPIRVVAQVEWGWTLACSGCPGSAVPQQGQGLPGPARGDAAQRLPQSQP